MIVENLFTKFKRGAIFNYDDGQKGRRPWIIISTDEYNNVSNNVIAAPMTTSRDVYKSIYGKYNVQSKNSNNEVYTIDLGRMGCVLKEDINKINSFISKSGMDAIDCCLSNIFFGTKYGDEEIENNDEEDFNIEDKINNPTFRRPLKLKSIGTTVIDSASYNNKKHKEKEIVEEMEMKKDNELLKKNQDEMNSFKALQKELNKIKAEYPDTSCMTIEDYKHIITLKNHTLRDWIVKDIEFFVNLTEKLETDTIINLFGFKTRTDVYTRKYNALKKLSKLISDN